MTPEEEEVEWARAERDDPDPRWLRRIGTRWYDVDDVPDPADVAD